MARSTSARDRNARPVAHLRWAPAKQQFGAQQRVRLVAGLGEEFLDAAQFVIEVPGAGCGVPHLQQEFHPCRWSDRVVA